jgi:hypothetical protein
MRRGSLSGTRQRIEGIGLFSHRLHDAERGNPAYKRVLFGIQEALLYWQFQPTRSLTTTEGTYGLCNLALDPDTTTPHRGTDGYADCPRKS